MASSKPSSPRLPRLPVPDLRKTLDRYLKSLQPLLKEDEARGGLPFELSYKKRLEWAAEFEEGIGRTCQRRLLALDRTSPFNWLDDNFWMKKTYLEWRAPLLINSNWWLTFINDDLVPKNVLREQHLHTWVGVSPWQVRRAAWLLHRVLDFKDRLTTQELYPDTTRTGIWLRESTAKMFNISRIPQVHCDALSEVPQPYEPNARKIVIMVHDFCYAVEVYDSHNRQIPVDVIEQRLREVVNDVSNRIERGDVAVPVGVLTADERDTWAANYQRLVSLSSTNARTLATIQQSIMVLSLDHYTHNSDPSTPAALNSQAEMDSHLHNIRSSQNAHNRWFDKAFTLIVERNSRAGAMGEHSPCDALVPSIVAEYAVVEGIDEAMFSRTDPTSSTPIRQSGGWERLEWVVDQKIKDECLRAENRAKLLIDNSDDSAFWFTDYGADWIKDVAQLSPDAYVQMVLQLAWYKSRGEFTATYETVLTRIFQHGRTETIRTLSSDSRNFVLAMADTSSSSTMRQALLRRAVQTHTALTREAATGRGIDRHLLGLHLVLDQTKGEKCELFDDELFQRSQTWKLSTSGLSAGHQFRGTGFGAPYEDGYGINYLIGPGMVKFCVESKYSSPVTSTAGFKKVIIDSLRDMRTVCSVALEHPFSTALL
ncbi:hypothetical protein SERLA73DRAFT_54801 [Serpula lacrymans var. lacrymans S7.3]|uniref:Choline/carnitine acyltransferase domain-containing protein n=2 Tax=Serpula lacrymans var. lacrymans TaxID=341189 RepID=F8PYC5_SERL3|nr:uncharacterized protein SERLADRAFT_349250 [Serpula lacrymans var. lacrymans S7.9]EGN98888.1 hypothetical protein SERLA73DRAFT_54801 [Serpula lacrymans var. lacrymans S7.3]EGO24483.1 hypothetical protein SERLADRAFT_349250 [Serpula lacrymans var. lacrymans S7.9]